MSLGHIPEQVVDSILQQVDIVDIIGRHVSLVKQGRNFSGLCPFHSEKTPSFLVSPDKQIFKCFGCGKGGNVFRFVMLLEGVSFPEAVRSLGEHTNVEHEWQTVNEPQTPEQIEREQLLAAHELAAKWYHSILMNTNVGRPAMDYLMSRGFTLKTIEDFQIGYAPPMWDKLAQFLTSKQYDTKLLDQGGLLRSSNNGYIDMFRDRVMFPIHDTNGKVIAFAGRVLNEGQPKYINTPDSPLFTKGLQLYNLHQAKAEMRKTKQVVLFEGYADVIKAWGAGVFNGVATMGTALSDKHMNRLKRFADEVVVCYDGDDAGLTAAQQSLELLERQQFKVRVAVVPDKLDPDDYIVKYGEEAFRRQIIQAAFSGTSFRLLRLRKQYKLSDREERLRYIRAALHVVAQLNAPTEREHYLQELSKEFSYSLDTLKQECAQIRQELEKKRSTGDNNDKPWNNVLNNRRVMDTTPALRPAYHNAERNLLAIMMNEPEITSYVAHKLGDGFNVEAHAVLAAYIYSYFSQNDNPVVSKFIGSLDEELSDLASDISMLYMKEAVTPQVVDDYILQIRKLPMQRLVERRKQEMLQAERSGDLLLAAQIGKEMITLEQQLKALQRD